MVCSNALTNMGAYILGTVKLVDETDCSGDDWLSCTALHYNNMF